jgi:hypothetical protein
MKQPACGLNPVRPGQIDLIIVTDVLPMRTLQEFVDDAISLYPGIPIFAVGEQLQISACPDEIIDRYTKPLSQDDLRTICCWTLNRDGKNARDLQCPGKSTFSAEMVGFGTNSPFFFASRTSLRARGLLTVRKLNAAA